MVGQRKTSKCGPKSSNLIRYPSLYIISIEISQSLLFFQRSGIVPIGGGYLILPGFIIPVLALGTVHPFPVDHEYDAVPDVTGMVGDSL